MPAADGTLFPVPGQRTINLDEATPADVYEAVMSGVLRLVSSNGHEGVTEIHGAGWAQPGQPAALIVGAPEPVVPELGQSTKLTFTITTALGRHAALLRRDDIITHLAAIGVRVSITHDGTDIRLADTGVPTLGEVIVGGPPAPTEDGGVLVRIAGEQTRRLAPGQDYEVLTMRSNQTRLRYARMEFMAAAPHGLRFFTYAAAGGTVNVDPAEIHAIRACPQELDMRRLATRVDDLPAKLGICPDCGGRLGSVAETWCGDPAPHAQAPV